MNNQDKKQKDINIENNKEETRDSTFASQNDVNMLKSALEYYDKNTETINKIFERVVYIKDFPSNSELENNVIGFYDEDKKLLFKSRYELMGLYQADTKLWTWGWALPTLKKNLVNIIKKILFYGIDLNTNSLFLKSELINSRFYISSKVQLDIHCAIASYLSKKPIIYGIKTFNNPVVIEDELVDITKSNSLENTKYLVQYVLILDPPKID